MIWWLIAVTVLGVACAATLVHRHLMTAQIDSLRRQLDEQMARDWFRPVTVQFVDSHVAELASAVNSTLDQLVARSSDERRMEHEFRQLTADLSHDLRTPLTAARGYTQALAAEPCTPLQHNRIAVVERNLQEVERLIDRLFEYTTLLDSNRVPQVEEFDLNREVTEVLLSHAGQLEATEIPVTVASSHPVMVRSERGHLQRIVSNLVANAATHGTGWLRVHVLPHASGARMIFSNGLHDGDPVEANRVFERFYTTDSARSTRRQGLGLAIVRSLTEQLGGTCWAETTTAQEVAGGRSLTVTVELPGADGTDP
ncbi:sensor histidine kinase [Kocuria sp.]|uniref:sensor histidine kinase n=1 Tax=Kocuria sp. TaxID=1871328 RepID=UPI0026E0EDB0|nr:HAMP domain-containing sensor histidine kinase [Kocuria sp.]MDO5618824.1 HAMP domain-containing sensor histidine kinase [Kocuria sp.]